MTTEQIEEILEYEQNVIDGINVANGILLCIVVSLIIILGVMLVKALLERFK